MQREKHFEKVNASYEISQQVFVFPNALSFTKSFVLQNCKESNNEAFKSNFDESLRHNLKNANLINVSNVFKFPLVEKKNHACPYSAQNFGQKIFPNVFTTGPSKVVLTKD